MGHIRRDCPNHGATKRPLSKRITFMDDKCKDCVNLVKIQDKIREYTITNFKQYLRNQIDIMAAKQMQEEL